MAVKSGGINYPGRQLIGYGKAQVFDTSQLAANVKFVGEKLEIRKKEKEKRKQDYIKSLTDIDISKIRNADVNYITSQVDAVSDYFYKNSAAIMNPKLDGGKAAMEIQRLKSFAVGEVQRSISIKGEDDLLNERINKEPNHFGTDQNYELLTKRMKTPINDPSWNDRRTDITEVRTSTAMTGDEKTDFYTKSVNDQKQLLEGRLPSNQLLNQYNNIDGAKEKQQFLLDQGYDLPKYGADGDFGTESKTAEKKFKDDMAANLEMESAGLESAANVGGYDTYNEYVTANPNTTILDETEFNNLKTSYNEYETLWNESQGTYETTTQGGEFIVGLNNRQLVPNAEMGKFIQDFASKITLDQTFVNQLEENSKYKIGEGFTNRFDIQKKASEDHIVNGMLTAIENNRFSNVMMAELNSEVAERQKQNPDFTINDLILEKSKPFVKVENDVKFINDIFKPKGSSFRVNLGSKPTPDEFAVPLPNYDDKIVVKSTSGPSIGGFQGMDWSYGALTEGNYKGVPIGAADISQVAKGEGGQSDVIEIRTSNKGFRQLYGTDNLGWKEKSSTIKMNPQFIFPAATFKNDITIDGIEFKAGDRVPTNITENDNLKKDFSQYLPSINADGEYELPQGIEIKYFLQGTIVKEGVGTNKPVIVEYGKQAGTVYSAVNAYIQRQSNSRNAFNIMNRNLLGIEGTNRAQ
tara:strand:+ start:1418 stop:3496 length:2079 start_codon:yes stop_codon:yes gene_type:complete